MDRMETEAHLRALFEAVPDAVITIDEWGAIRSFNPAAERLFGWAAAEVVGKNVSLLAVEPHRSLHDLYLARYREGGRALVLGVPREVEGVRRDGRRVPLDLTVAEGQVDGARFFTGVLRDITERAQARRQLQETSATLEAQARRIAEQNAALARASRHKSELLANVSHELRAPLDTIVGFAALLADGAAGPLAPRQQEFSDRIVKAGRHLLALVDDLIDLSRIEAGGLQLDLAPIDPGAVFGGALEVAAPAAAARGVTVESRVADDVAGFVADGLRLYQVTTNLLSNGAKFTPPGGRVRLEVTRGAAPDRLELVVEDTGIGIAQADLGRLFQPFVRLAGAEQAQGSGLGLALVKRLVELHGGRVEVTSAPGAGSRFAVTIPAPPPPPSGVPHVLLVSADATLTELASALLGPRAVVSTAADVAGAWSIAARRPPDAVVVDAGLGGVRASSGRSPLELLRAHPSLARTPGAVLPGDDPPAGSDARRLLELLRRLVPAL